MLAGEFQATVTPVIVFFILCDIIGFFGNIVVLYIYSFRYRKNGHRCVVIALSIVDFVSCCTTVPMETVSTWYWFESPSIILCKAKNFFVQMSALSAMYMLFVTSVYKYRRICKPFGKQVGQRMIVILCGVGTSSAMVLATPAPILWGVNNDTVLTNKTEIDMICEVDINYSNTIYPTIYRHILSAFVVFLLTAIILYSFVAKTTYQHYQKMTKRLKSYSSATELSLTSGESMSNPKADSQNLKERKVTVSQQVLENEERPSQPTNKVDRDKTNNKVPKVSGSIKHSSKSKLSRNEIRTVLIMLIIAGTFSVTFMMGLSFGYVFAIRTYSDYSSVRELITLFACYRLYFINYAMNPIVYFALDRYFRREVLALTETICHAVRSLFGHN